MVRLVFRENQSHSTLKKMNKLLITLLALLLAGAADAQTVQTLYSFTNAPSALVTTNQVILPYRATDTLKFFADGRMALIYWAVESADTSVIDLIYAEQNTNGQWNTTAIDYTGYLGNLNGGIFGDGTRLNNFAPPAALLIDSFQNAHIVYVDTVHGPTLYHYANSPSGWNLLGYTNVAMQNNYDCFGAVIGSGDTIQVITGGDTSGPPGMGNYTYVPVHYKWQNTGWVDMTAAEGPMLPLSPGEYTVAQSYAPRPFSIAVDSNNVLHVAYTPTNLVTATGSGPSSAFSQLAYMNNKAGYWTNQIVVNPSNGHDDSGLGASIAINPNGLPAIASFYCPRATTGSASGGSLYYNQRDSAGVWHTTTVSSTANGYTAGDGNEGTGFAPALLFDVNGAPHIVFTDHASQHFSGQQDEFGGNVRHAWLTGGSWQIQTVLTQANPLVNQFFWPTLAASPRQLATLGMVSVDRLDASLSITNNYFYLSLIPFTPAGYVDTTPPALTVTAPTAGQSVNTAGFTVQGTASDNVAVGAVFYNLNHNGWLVTTSTNHFTNWWIAVTLVPGTNTLSAYAIDNSGNVSATNNINFQYALNTLFNLATNGFGTVSPNYGGTLLQIGRNYSITANPATGFAFTNWTVLTNGMVWFNTNGSGVQFMMQTGLTAQVNFVETAAPSLSIITPSASQRLTNAIAYVAGTASDAWKIATIYCQLNSGAWFAPASTNGFTNWTQTLTLPQGTNQLKAWALNGGGNHSATSSVSFYSSNAFQLLLYCTNKPTPAQGLKLNLALSPGLNGHVLVSTNLLTWITLTNFTSTNSVLTIYDPGATNQKARYYRAVVP